MTVNLALIVALVAVVAWALWCYTRLSEKHAIQIRDLLEDGDVERQKLIEQIQRPERVPSPWEDILNRTPEEEGPPVYLPQVGQIVGLPGDPEPDSEIA